MKDIFDRVVHMQLEVFLVLVKCAPNSVKYWSFDPKSLICFYHKNKQRRVHLLCVILGLFTVSLQNIWRRRHVVYFSSNPSHYFDRRRGDNQLSSEAINQRQILELEKVIKMKLRKKNLLDKAPCYESDFSCSSNKLVNFFQRKKYKCAGKQNRTRDFC